MHVRRSILLGLALTALAACSEPTAPADESAAAVVFPTAAVDWREDVPVPWTHTLAADGGCHVRAEMIEGWPTRWGTITIYPTVYVDGEWKQTGLSYLHLANIVALDRMFSPRGFTFYEGTFDAQVLVKAVNKRGQQQLVQTVFACRTKTEAG